MTNSVILVIRDVTLHRRADLRQATQYAVTRVLADSPTVEAGLPLILEAIGTGMGWPIGAFWFVSADGSALQCQGQWHAREFQAVEFETLSRKMTFAPGIGLPGRVWASGETDWVPDVTVDMSGPRSPTAHREGLRAGFAFPILAGANVVGVAEFFAWDIRLPDTDLLEMAASIGSQIGQFIERRHAEEALRQREEQLRQGQKMEAIGRLAGGIAHDFNNILTAILGFAEFVGDAIPKNSQARADIDEITRAAERAVSLTMQLLAFSRKQVLRPTVLDLNIVIIEMNRMLHRVIREDIQLATTSSESACRVKADRGQIEQVLMNLVVNARDALPQGGQITLSVGNVDLDESHDKRYAQVVPGPYVMFSVSDDGVGMSPEVLSCIFEPFFTTKPIGLGTGLGLATVHGIVEQSGGYIWADSAPGQGTTFKVYLPSIDEPLDVEVGSILAEESQCSETILLVEDDDSVRALAERVLQTQGYVVLVADGPLEAIRLTELYLGSIHLMVTDVIMPQMSGPELARRQSTRRPATRILYMSGYSGGAIDHHGVLDPGTNFLKKPFGPGELTRKVREVLDQT